MHLPRRRVGPADNVFSTSVVAACERVVRRLGLCKLALGIRIFAMLYALSCVLPSQLIYFYRTAGVGVAPCVIQLQIDHSLVRARRRVSSTYAPQTAF